MKFQSLKARHAQHIHERYASDYSIAHVKPSTESNRLLLTDYKLFLSKLWVMTPFGVTKYNFGAAKKLA